MFTLYFIHKLQFSIFSIFVYIHIFDSSDGLLLTLPTYSGLPKSTNSNLTKNKECSCIFIICINNIHRFYGIQYFPTRNHTIKLSNKECLSLLMDNDDKTPRYLRPLGLLDELPN